MVDRIADGLEEVSEEKQELQRGFAGKGGSDGDGTRTREYAAMEALTVAYKRATLEVKTPKLLQRTRELLTVLGAMKDVFCRGLTDESPDLVTPMRPPCRTEARAAKAKLYAYPSGRRQ